MLTPEKLRASTSRSQSFSSQFGSDVGLELRREEVDRKSRGSVEIRETLELLSRRDFVLVNEARPQRTERKWKFSRRLANFPIVIVDVVVVVVTSRTHSRAPIEPNCPRLVPRRQRTTRDPFTGVSQDEERAKLP